MKAKTLERLMILSIILVFLYPASTYAAPDPVMELDYTFSEPILEQIDDEYYSVEMLDTGKFQDAIGLPLLPVRTAKILIPQRHSVKAINVAPGRRVSLDGEFKVEYGRPSVPMGLNVRMEAKPDAKVYNSSEPFPGNLYSVVSTQYLCGYKILILNLYPVQYIPASGKVYYYENMKVIVAHAPSGPPGIQIAKCRGLRSDRARVERLVDNPSEVNMYAADVGALEGPYEYVIVTNEAMANAFQALASSKGTRVKGVLIETIENILSNPAYSGSDDQETLRNFIRYAHDNWGTQYVVLGGDADTARAKWKPIIPYRGVHGEVTGVAADGSLGDYISDDIPCDMYYGALDGSWDFNGNGIYGEYDDGVDGGEVDLFAEVFIGRISADDATEALNQINKIIKHENGTSPQTDSVLLVGRKGDDITWGGDHKDEVYTYFPSWLATKLYERDGTYTQGALISEMNSGLHHVVNYCSHSSYTSDMGLSNDQIASLNNTKYFLAYSQGCMSGGFDSGTRPRDDCAGEHFTVENGNGGAFAYIGNTRYGWYIPGYPPQGASQQFDKEIFHAIFTENIHNIGRALQDSKEDLSGFIGPKGAMRWCYFELCLLGDPETPIIDYIVLADTTAPAAVVDISIGNVSADSIELTWTAPADDDNVVESGNASKYDIRYSLGDSGVDWENAQQCEKEPLPAYPGTQESFIVTGLSPNETYSFALKTADEVPNWSGISNTPSATTGSAQTMHIASVNVHCIAKAVFINAEATVTIVDSSDTNVTIEGALVEGTWSGCVNGSGSGLTGSDGTIGFTSSKVKYKNEPLTFIFTVTNVTKDGWVCDNIGMQGEDTYPQASPMLAESYQTCLENAYPNPGNPDIWIPFSLSKMERVVIRIYDATGRLVKLLDLGDKPSGAYLSREKAAYWDGRNESGEQVASGIYFYNIQAGEFTATRKMLMLK